MRSKIVRNVAWLLAERAFQVGGGIVAVALIARGLGPEGFAHFQYAQSLVLIASSVALICGAEVVVPRLVADPRPGAQRMLMAHVFGLREVGAIAGYLLLLGGTALGVQDGVTLPTVTILGLSILMREPFGVVTAWMQSRTNNRASTLFSLLALGLKVAGIGALYALHVHAVHLYAWPFVAESVVIVALLAHHYLHRSPPEAVHPDPTLARRLLRDGAVYWLGLMFMFSAKRIDQIILKPQVPLAELGAYAASMQILDNFVLLAAIIGNAAAPLAVYAKPTLAAARRNVLRLAAGMSAIGLAGGTAIAACAPWIISLLYGHRFAAAADLLQLAALGSVLVFADAGLSLLIVYLRKPAWLAGKWLLVLACTAIVDWLAIPSLGTRGAVLGYIAGNALAVVAGIGICVLSRQAVTREQPA